MRSGSASSSLHAPSELQRSAEGRGEDPTPSTEDATRSFEPVESFPREAIGNLANGDVIGPYRVIDRIGEGGMGSVYSAEDSRLRRQVALKVLRADVRMDGEAVGRLRREARALATLSHTNVVQVYGVEQEGELLCVAMEYVAGSDLKRWLAAQRREPATVLEVFRQAGLGLAAAHAAGLVHRDFKPANVLLGEDGRVRVADFGLARSAGEGPSVHWDGEAMSSIAAPSDPSLTAGHTIMGTPRYMAPEQHAGDAIDARADQFAFCTALFEALTGLLPWAPGELHEQKRRGPAQARLQKLPRWLRPTLARGLAPLPQNRFPTMEALLTRLHRQRWRRLPFLAPLALLPAVLWPRDGEDDCASGAERIASAWSGGHRSSVAAALYETDPAGWALHSPRLIEVLDAQAQQWRTAYLGICEAREARAVEAYDRQMLCLLRVRQALQTQIQTFAEQPGTKAADALTAALALPSVSTCADAQRLLTAAGDDPRPPPHLRDAVEALRPSLEQVRSLRRTARPEAAISTAERALADAEAVGFAPFTNMVRRELAALHLELHRLDDAAAMLEQVYFGAKAENQSLLAADAAQDLAYCRGYRQGRQEEGARWLAYAWAELTKRPDELVHHVLVYRAEGQLLLRQQQYVQAIEVLEKALRLSERIDPESEQSMSLLGSIGNAWTMLRNGSKAVEIQRRRVDVLTRRFGSQHPRLHLAKAHLAGALFMADQYDEAVALFRECLEIEERAVGEQHWSLINVLTNLGSVLVHHGQLEEAERTLRRAEALAPEALKNGEQHAVLTARSTLVSLCRLTGRLDEAETMVHRVLAQLPVAGDPTRTQMLVHLGDIARLRGDTEQALVGYERALREAEASELTSPFVLADIYWNYAAVSMERKADDQALELLDRSLSILRKTAENGSQPPEAIAPLGLRATILWGRDRDAARRDVDALLELVAGSARELAPELALDLAKRVVDDDRALAVKIADAAVRSNQSAPGAPGQAIAAVQQWLAQHSHMKR